MSTARKTIREISIGVYDGPHATPPLHDEGAAIFLGIPNLSKDGQIDVSNARWVAEQDLETWTRRVTPQENDIVFTYEATLNRYAIIPSNIKFCLGRRTALIRPDPTKIDHRFLFYYFFSVQWRAQIEAKTLTGATVDRIPLKSFPEFEVFAPDLPVQKRIADVLSTYDTLIENNQRRIALLEESARLLYREWFVNLRFPGWESVRIEDGMPQDWQLRPLGDIAPLKYGKALKAEERKGGNVPVYGSSGIVGNHNQAIVGAGAIIVGRKGNIGSLYHSTTPCFPIDTVFYIEPDRVTLRLFLAMHDLNFISSDAAVPGLNRNYAHSLQILVPSKTVSEAFEALVAPIFDQIMLLNKQNSRLAEARNALLPKLMSGEIQV